jgi:hypothetical protein
MATEEAPTNTLQDTPRSRLQLASDLLKPENWPTPKWYDERKQAKELQTYQEYFAFQLRARYLEIENDFRAVVGNFPQNADFVTGGRIVDLLHSARESLEQEAPNLLMISNALDLVERYMVWLYPPWMTEARVKTVLLKLGSLSFKGKELLTEQLVKLSELEGVTNLGQTRSVLDEAIGTINSQVVQNHIGRGLQINRLRLLRIWGLLTLVILLAGSPFTTDIGNVSGWPSQLIIGDSDLIVAWLNASAMVLMGAVGGFLSGLLQARSTQVTLTEYLENMLKLQLRPLVGGLVALILYVLLSWQVLPGIIIETAGSYFIVAFLSGFSERYFLRLLDIKADTVRPSEEVDVAQSMNERSAPQKLDRYDSY